MTQIYQQTRSAIEELVEKANIKPGNIVVVGCSTSEVLGKIDHLVLRFPFYYEEDKVQGIFKN